MTAQKIGIWFALASLFASGPCRADPPKTESVLIQCGFDRPPFAGSVTIPGAFKIMAAPDLSKSLEQKDCQSFASTSPFSLSFNGISYTSSNEVRLSNVNSPGTALCPYVKWGGSPVSDATMLSDIGQNGLRSKYLGAQTIPLMSAAGYQIKVTFQPQDGVLLPSALDTVTDIPPVHCTIAAQ